MGARSALCLVFTACYAAKPVPGTPCEPALANCPDGLACTTIGGRNVCATAGDGDVDGFVPTPDAELTGDASASDAVVGSGWTIVQTAGRTSRNLDLLPTGAGHLIVVAVETDDNTTVNSVSDDADTVYTRIDSSRAVNENEGFGVEMWFTAASDAGARKINVNGGTVFAVVAWEVAGIDAVDPIGMVSHTDNQAISGMPFGAAITTSTPGELVIAVAIVANEVTDVVAGSPFTNDHTTFGNGWAHLTDNHAPPGLYRARWTQPMAGRSCASSVAFRAAP